MKNYNRVLVAIVLFATLVMSWVITPLIEKATYSSSSYPLGYYSSMLGRLMMINRLDKDFPMVDLEGNKYNTKQYDSLIPEFNYRQLVRDGILPDSMHGVEVSQRIFMIKSVVATHRPRYFLTPKAKLNGMLESMPLRGGLSEPTDLFRIDDCIEFIDAETNRVNEKKSAIFAKAFEKQGYKFPTQWAAGDCNTRKSYDEGYFCLDADGELFHVKMVNGRPYVRNTKAADEVDILYYMPYNSTDKRFYGFIFSRQGGIYILEGDWGKYTPRKLDVPAVDITRDNITILGNIFNWNVAVTNGEGRSYYVIDSEELKFVTSHHIAREQTLWDLAQQWLVPFTIDFKDSNSDYIYPRLRLGSWWSLVVNLLLAMLTLSLSRKLSCKERIFKSVLVLLTGLAGFVAQLILPNFRRKI